MLDSESGNVGTGRTDAVRVPGADAGLLCVPPRCHDVKPPPAPSLRIGPAAWVAVLLGIPLGMVIAGLAVRFHELFEGDVPSQEAFTGVIVGVSLCTLAIGVRMPQRFASWVCALAWRRFAVLGRRSEMSGVLLSPGGVDRPLHRLVLSVISLAAGVLIALLPIFIRLAGAAYEWMHGHFLWSAVSLGMLQTAIVFAAGLVPLTVVGLGISCVYHVGRTEGRWEPKITAWLLTGTSAGVLIAGSVARVTVRSDLLLLAGSLPALLAALLCALSRSSREDSATVSAGFLPEPPLWSERWPMLLRTSIAAVAGSGAAAISVWAHHPLKTAGHTGAVVAAALAAIGIGILAGCRVRSSALRSIGGFGATCVIAGLIVAASTLALKSTPRGALGGALMPAYLSLAAIGFATAYGWQALLNRVGSRSGAGATMLTHALVCSALTVWIGVPLARRLVGQPAALVTVALSLLALGGTLIIHEPRYSPRTRRARLCTVFGSVATMTVLAWLMPHWWQRRSEAQQMPAERLEGEQRNRPTSNRGAGHRRQAAPAVRDFVRNTRTKT